MRPTKTTANVKVFYSDAERQSFGDELARASLRKGELEEQKKRVDAELKARIEEQVEQISKTARQLTSGYEYRDVDCRIEYDQPKRGYKLIVRTDTGEIVRETPMSGDELQEELPLATEPVLSVITAPQANPAPLRFEFRKCHAELRALHVHGGWAFGWDVGLLDRGHGVPGSADEALPSYERALSCAAEEAVSYLLGVISDGDGSPKEQRKIAAALKEWAERYLLAPESEAAAS